MTFPRIKHQSQPTSNTCVTTCLAMLAGKPVSELIAQGFHHSYAVGDASYRKLFEKLGLKFKSFDTAERNSMMLDGGVYLVGVPSLNIQGGMHEILVEISADGGGWTILDPNYMAQHKRADGSPPLYYDVPGGMMQDDPLSVELGGGYTVEAFLTYKDLGLE